MTAIIAVVIVGVLSSMTEYILGVELVADRQWKLILMRTVYFTAGGCIFYAVSLAGCLA